MSRAAPKNVHARCCAARNQVRRERFARLTSPLALIDGVEGAAQAVYDLALRRGMEGVVAKNLASPCVVGATDEWIKTKPARTHDGWARSRLDAARRR